MPESEATNIYNRGITKLSEFLSASGFALFSYQSAVGKGGLQRKATFRKHNYSISVFFVSDIVAIHYSIGNVSLPHRKYMRYLSGGGSPNYPDVRKFDPNKSFDDVILDLEQWGSDFLTGEGRLFALAAKMNLHV